MSGKGNDYGSPAVETLFKAIKAELIRWKSWEPRQQAEMAIFEFITGFDNRADVTQHWAEKAL